MSHGTHVGWLRLVGSFKLQVSFAKSSVLWGSFAKETYNLKEPTSRSHPIGNSDDRVGEVR